MSLIALQTLWRSSTLKYLDVWNLFLLCLVPAFMKISLSAWPLSFNIILDIHCWPLHDLNCCSPNIVAKSIHDPQPTQSHPWQTPDRAREDTWLVWKGSDTCQLPLNIYRISALVYCFLPTLGEPLAWTRRPTCNSRAYVTYHKS